MSYLRRKRKKDQRPFNHHCTWTLCSVWTTKTTKVQRNFAFNHYQSEVHSSENHEGKEMCSDLWVKPHFCWYLAQTKTTTSATGRQNSTTSCQSVFTRHTLHLTSHHLWLCCTLHDILNQLFYWIC